MRLKVRTVAAVSALLDFSSRHTAPVVEGAWPPVQKVDCALVLDVEAPRVVADGENVRQ